MIEKLAQKLVTQYDNLSPRKKALADISSIFIGVALGSSVMFVAARFGLVLEFAIAMICYGIFGMLKVLYKSRVSYYETLERLKK